VKQKPLMADGDAAVLGRPKEGTSHFSALQELRAKRWVSIRTAIDKPGVLQSVFPIQVCTVEFFRERWGAGVYKCTWLQVDPDTGKSQTLGPGRRFEVMAPAPPEPPPPPAPEAPKKKIKVKLKRSSLKAQLSVLSQLQAMTRESVNAAVGERVAFIQAEAQRNREHQIELERLRMRGERDRRAAEPAPAAADNAMGEAVAAGIGEIVKKLDAVAGGGDGEGGEASKIVKLLEPTLTKVASIVEKVVLDRLGAGPGDDDDDDDDEQDDDEEQETEATQ
jgi:hypothetical protein